MISHLSVLFLCSVAAYAQLQYGATGPYGVENAQGPVLRTGRFRLIHDRILGSEHYGDTYNDKAWEQEKEEETAENGMQREAYHYDRPLDGRKVYLYKRVHTPVRVTNGEIERLGPGEIVDRWAEGGYHGAQRANINVFHRVGHNIYQDRVVPLKESLDGPEFL